MRYFGARASSMMLHTAHITFFFFRATHAFFFFLSACGFISFGSRCTLCPSVPEVPIINNTNEFRAFVHRLKVDDVFCCTKECGERTQKTNEKEKKHGHHPSLYLVNTCALPPPNHPFLWCALNETTKHAAEEERVWKGQRPAQPRSRGEHLPHGL